MSHHRSLLFAIVMIITICVTGAAFASDLTIKVDKEKNLANITSSLASDVTLLYLVGTDNRRLPLFGKLKPGKTVQVPIRFTVPESVSHATCEIADPPKGYEKERDNYYHLTVDIL